MNILTIVGARPQFIKAAPVSQALRARHREVLVHTGQHYDANMSDVFFAELGIPEPDANLGIGSGSHGQQTGRMLMAIEEVLLAERPDWLLVYGDTNSTLAAALAAVKLGVPVAHVEAGLRSFNRAMPEEHNRVLTDHCADLLFCPTLTAVNLLAAEGLTAGVHLVGDVMVDALRQHAALARQRSDALARLGLGPQSYLLATVHRPYNTDAPDNLRSIFAALGDIYRQSRQPVVLPLHPRTRRQLDAWGLQPPAGVRLLDPVGYLDMLALEQAAALILTDSGGVQKEAYTFAVPCITLRPETEWVETVQAGWNVVVGADRDAIVQAATQHRWPDGPPPPLFGDGHAAERIVAVLEQRHALREMHR
jgi:UDP-N-acetylglucosamine 2-epimerase